MKQETRYAYEKRIKALQQEVCDLTIYKLVALDIQENTLECLASGANVGRVWILRQFKRVQK